MKKTILALCIVVSLIWQQIAPIVAQEIQTNEGSKIEIAFKVGEDILHINGTQVKVEMPFVIEGTTLVPLRVITEAFGASVDWNDIDKTIALTFEGVRIGLQIDNKEASVDQKAIPLLQPPQLVNGKTMVPLRFISESFGAAVQFDPSTSQITVTKQMAKKPQAVVDLSSQFTFDSKPCSVISQKSFNLDGYIPENDCSFAIQAGQLLVNAHTPGTFYAGKDVKASDGAKTITMKSVATFPAFNKVATLTYQDALIPSKLLTVDTSTDINIQPVDAGTQYALTYHAVTMKGNNTLTFVVEQSKIPIFIYIDQLSLSSGVHQIAVKGEQKVYIVVNKLTLLASDASFDTSDKVTMYLGGIKYVDRNSAFEALNVNIVSNNDLTLQAKKASGRFYLPENQLSLAANHFSGSIICNDFVGTNKTIGKILPSVNTPFIVPNEWLENATQTSKPLQTIAPVASDLKYKLQLVRKVAPVGFLGYFGEADKAIVNGKFAFIAYHVDFTLLKPKYDDEKLPFDGYYSAVQMLDITNPQAPTQTKKFYFRHFMVGAMSYNEQSKMLMVTGKKKEAVTGVEAEGSLMIQIDPFKWQETDEINIKDGSGERLDFSKAVNFEDDFVTGTYNRNILNNNIGSLMQYSAKGNGIRQWSGENIMAIVPFGKKLLTVSSISNDAISQTKAWKLSSNEPYAKQDIVACNVQDIVQTISVAYDNGEVKRMLDEQAVAFVGLSQDGVQVVKVGGKDANANSLVGTLPNPPNTKLKGLAFGNGLLFEALGSYGVRALQVFGYAGEETISKEHFAVVAAEKLALETEEGESFDAQDIFVVQKSEADTYIYVAGGKPGAMIYKVVPLTK
ncbi:MAG: copper amine oxidase N-terminal domain-containing protein [Hyphomonadaceae bacterium]|nr:copper amine oxidase N-terminal domain-containing protein [Clostridia bacterium]